MCYFQEPVEESVSTSVSYQRVINFPIDAYLSHCQLSIFEYVTMTLQQNFRVMGWNENTAYFNR